MSAWTESVLTIVGLLEYIFNIMLWYMVNKNLFEAYKQILVFLI